ncbi:PIG-L deacetylase family protein [Nocardia aobensis]|uniref:PIG-L deacetylase family protein n=1 Tax=Nocardia aobensis TaxID=257277 RepID=A0ABW6P1C6_9NOCA
MTSDSASPPALMVVMAHPDDESTSAGGVLSLYARRGVRTVLVTCTNGEYGDGIAGAKPGSAGHSAEKVARTRLAELRTACTHLGVDALELLSHHDSGSIDQIRPACTVFADIPLQTVAEELSALIDRHRPQVVVTHEPTGTRHVDHIHAATATEVAVRAGNVVAKLYYAAHGTRYWNRVRGALRQAGIDYPEPDTSRRRVTDRIDEQIAARIDIRSVVSRKRAALFSHVSQIHTSTTAKVPVEYWPAVFAVEEYIRAYDVSGAPVPEVDLFAGLF